MTNPIATRIVESITPAIPEEIRGYTLAVEPGQGPRIYFTLKGAEGDTTAARLAREELVPLARKFLDEEGAEWVELRPHSVNRGDDLVLQVTIWFPE